MSGHLPENPEGSPSQVRILNDCDILCSTKSNCNLITEGCQSLQQKYSSSQTFSIFTHDLLRQRKSRSCCPIVVRDLTWSMICKGDSESMSCASFGQSSPSARAEAVWGFSNVLVAFVTCKLPGSVTDISLLSFDRLYDFDCQDRVC